MGTTANMGKTTNLVIPAELELQFDRLLQAFEPPFALITLQGRDAEELLDRLFRFRDLLLLGIVVLVLDVYVAGFFVVFLVLEVVPGAI